MCRRTLQETKHTVLEGEEGLYSLVFVRCSPPSASVSFKIHAKFYNPGPFDRPNYLSAGEAALPTLYFGYFVLYGLALGSWLYVLRSHKDHVSDRDSDQASALLHKALP